MLHAAYTDEITDGTAALSVTLQRYRACHELTISYLRGSLCHGLFRIEKRLLCQGNPHFRF